MNEMTEIGLWIVVGIVALLVGFEPLLKIGEVVADWIERRFGR